jgi:hypothetical protein
MRNRDRRPPFRSCIKCSLDDLLGLRVQGTGRFVEEEDSGPTKEGTRDGDTLFLAAREERGFRAHGGGETVAVRILLAGERQERAAGLTEAR